MIGIRTLVSSRYFLWALLALPAVFMMVGYWQETVIYGEVVHATGEMGARLLILTMAATPLCLMFPGAAWPRWLLQRRRYFGVASFAYALLHAVVYIARQADLAAIVEDALEIGMWTGWIAFFVMLALAVTSNDASVRMMRRNWKRLHRWVYAGALLAFLHWVLSAFDPIPGAIHAALLLALEIYRIVKTRASSAVRT